MPNVRTNTWQGMWNLDSYCTDKDIKVCTLQLNSILPNTCVLVIYIPPTGKFKFSISARYDIWGADKSLARPEGNKLRSMSGTHMISTTMRCELSSSVFPQGKALKEIHAILTETLAFFPPGWAKDSTAPLYCNHCIHQN